MGRGLVRLIATGGALLLAAGTAAGAARRILYVTATAGYRHVDSIEASVEVFGEVARESGVLEVVHTEDLSLINAAALRDFDAVYFFTSGELPLDAQQKADLLAFVRDGKGFGGSHSATDTLYSWPEYGEMIGGYFHGHPWTREAAVDVEDPQNPIVAHMAPGFRALEEFYQFREFSRDSVRVLLTLDTRSVDLAAPGVERTDGDFALAWIRNYGRGRVFYSAFGHFPDSFRLPVFRTMLRNALLWLVGEIELDAAPRSGPSSPEPMVAPDGVRNLAGESGVFAPGSLVAITGEGLTSGSTAWAAGVPLPVRLAGTRVEVDGVFAPLFSVAPDAVVAQLPMTLEPGREAALTVSSVNRAGGAVALRIEAAAPRIVAGFRAGNAVTLYAAGLGVTEPATPEGSAAPPGQAARTALQPVVRVGGRPAAVSFAGLAPGWVGLYQVNAGMPPDAEADACGALPVVIEAAGQSSNVFALQ